MTRLALLVFLLGCRGTPRDAITWEERWEVLVLTEHGNLLDTRLIVSNRELLKGQGRVHMDHWSESSMAVIHTREVSPANVHIDPHGDRIQIGLDQLIKDGPWKLQIGSTEANLVLEMHPVVEPPAAVTWLSDGGQWSMEALVATGETLGWLEAGGRGGHFNGRAVVLHRGGDGSPELPREGLFIMTQNVSIGIDQQDGATLAWAWVDGAAIPLDDLAFSRSAEGATLDFRPAADLVIEVRAQDPVGSSNPLGHFSWLERQAARVWTDVAWRRIEAGHATLTQGEQITKASAILLSEGPDFEPIGNTETPE